MKLSELNLEIVSQYLQYPIEMDDKLQILEFNIYIDSARAYICNYVGVTLEKADELPYLVPATLLLISDMLENKTLDGAKVENRTFRYLVDLNKELYL